MKFRMLLSALLLAAGLVFVTGCGKKADPKAEAKKKADTPTEVVSKFIAAVKQCDFDTAAKLCDGKLKTEMEQAGKEFKTASEADKKAAKEQMAGFKAEIKGEKIEYQVQLQVQLASLPSH